MKLVTYFKLLNYYWLHVLLVS